ncbi:hypothetical protein F5Y01DRAFT_110084 [Xylaria sp. FL0043]|nr:hypothetical protein F5Y01DRAFT_110084 [Xylaria sp. FL0043]
MMFYQTRSMTRQQAEQGSIRQTRSRARQQQQGGRQLRPQPRIFKTAAATRKLNSQKRASQPVTGAAAGVTNGPRRKSAQKPPLTFNLLPLEIRLMVWEEFVRTPRIIHIDVLQAFPVVCGYSWSMFSRCGKREQVCPLLGVNHESRRVALKEPLIQFDIQYPVSPRKRLHEDFARRYFAIRSHDIVFFKNSESLSRHYMWTYTAQNIVNVMFDQDITQIIHGEPDAPRRWLPMFTDAQGLIRQLKNLDHLQNLYCLTWDPAADEPEHFDLDNLQELTPKSFPKHKKALQRWLFAFDTFPIPTRSPDNIFCDDFAALKKVWKNVTLG